MKRITIKKLELKNFKNHSSFVVDMPPTGQGSIVVSGHNGSGKSSILEAVMFCLGASVEAGKVINQTIKAPASVSLTIEHPDGVDTFTRTLTPTLDQQGKITASTSSYVISGVPCKKTEYDTRVNQMFGTRDWQYLVNPRLVPYYKDARSTLLVVAGCPTEKEFLQTSNPALAEKIGNTDFSDFEKREKAIIHDLGKKIDAIPGRTEENAAMLQEVPEAIYEAPIHARLAEIREVLKGVDQANAEKADQYNKVACEAQSLRTEAQKLRNEAAQKVAAANKSANKQADEADALIAEWNRTLAGLRRQADQIKAEMSEARQNQQRKEAKVAEICANIQTLANQCREIGSRVPSADGNCVACGVYCPQLQAKGLQAAAEANARELDEVKKNGRFAVQQRDHLLGQVDEIAKKIDILMSQEHEIEAKINALGQAPTAPERTIITETPESLQLIGQAQELEEKAEKLIKSNRLDIAQKPTELVEELQQLNETLTRGAAATQTQKNNDKINARIEELREEESALITTQLQHKQHIAQLKEFYKSYADSVTASVNKLFDGTGYKIRLFDTNMSNDKGVPVMLPMKDGSTNLSTAEALIFNLRFVERVLMKHFKVQSPVLVDNAECVSQWGLKVIGKHQSIIAVVTESPFAVHKLDGPKEAQSQSK